MLNIEPEIPGILNDGFEAERDLLKVVSRSGVEEVLSTLERGSMKFSALMFETKLNPGVLNRHLKALLELGFVERDDGTYLLTEKGRKLVRILEEFKKILNEDDGRLKVISKSGMSDVLHALERGSMKFSALMFETKLNPGVLNRHLKALLELGFVEKVENRYILTEKGKKLVKILEKFRDFVKSGGAGF